MRDLSALFAMFLMVVGFMSMTPGTALGQVTPGCTDASAVNFDPAATEDDGSCVFNPCFNATACNFDPELEWNEGPCVFADEGFDCDGNCLADDNNNGICDALEQGGCTDNSACNYDATATFDDGTCDYVSCPVFGCTSPFACNFNPNAVFNNSSCDFLSCAGCTLSSACNYDPEATLNNGTCDFISCRGCTDPDATNYDPDALIDDGSCEIMGCTNAGACNFDINATVNDGSCDFLSCLPSGCLLTGACNYDPTALVAGGECIFPEDGYDCDGICLNDTDGDGVCVEVYGCQDATACNYDPNVTDQGPCVFADDPCESCSGELDGTGYVIVSDTDGDGICDDVDECFGELDECGVCGGIGIAPGECDCEGNVLDVVGVCGGTCTADEDADGICDDVDECIGAVDFCGVCNGPGAIYECGCAEIPEGDCNCLGSQEDAIGVCGGDCEADEDGDGVCDCEGNQLDALGVCGGACTADEDEDGVCDDVDSCVGEFDECGFCNGPGEVDECGCDDIPAGDCDCEGNQLDALSVCGGTCTADADEDGVCDDVDSCVGEVDECGVCNGPGAVWECGCINLIPGFCDCDWNQYDALGVCGGTCTEDTDEDGVCDNVDNCVGAFDACGICNGPGAVYECGCADIPAGDCDCEGSQEDAIGVCGGNCVEDDDNNGVCDTDEILGCTYELADNYDPTATRDDGLCEFPCSGDINQNVFDWDGDSAVTIADFLAMLAVFGDVDVDSDGVWDSSDECTDLAACNYADDPSTPCQFLDVLGVCGGGCEADMDSDEVCDDIDDCIGVVDECGVCNGPGPTEVVIEDITIIYDSVYAENIDTWFVYELGADTTFSITCAPFFGDCGDPVSYQGYDYATVLIGDQCWFAENLRSENYENGDAIPSNLSDSEWVIAYSGAIAVFGEGSSGCDDYNPDGTACDEAWSLSEYGRFYNWYAVDDARGLCPSGWHVPTDGEWTVLTDYLGGASVAGGQMKTTYGWCCEDNGTNSSGFSGLPGGYRTTNGNFNYAGYLGRWWSSSPNGSFAWYRTLWNNNENVHRHHINRLNGFSVRCVRDAE